MGANRDGILRTTATFYYPCFGLCFGFRLYRCFVYAHDVLWVDLTDGPTGVACGEAYGARFAPFISRDWVTLIYEEFLLGGSPQVPFRVFLVADYHSHVMRSNMLRWLLSRRKGYRIVL